MQSAQESGPVPPLNMVADYGGGGISSIWNSGGNILLTKLERAKWWAAAMTDGVPLLLGGAHARLAMGLRDEREANIGRRRYFMEL